MSIIISSISLVVSLLFICDKRPICIWIENICIGVFASGILMTFSSVVGYIKEEKHLLREYHWKLSELKECAVELVTIPVKESTIYSEQVGTTFTPKVEQEIYDPKQREWLYGLVEENKLFAGARNKVESIVVNRNEEKNFINLSYRPSMIKVIIRYTMRGITIR